MDLPGVLRGSTEVLKVSRSFSFGLQLLLLLAKRRMDMQLFCLLAKNLTIYLMNFDKTPLKIPSIDF